MVILSEAQKAAYFHRSYTAVDGLWFMKVEERFGFDTALEIDAEVWKVLPKIQARWFKTAYPMKLGLDALDACFTAKLDLDGFKFEAAKNESGDLLTIKITECPWHNKMISSNRESLSAQVGSRICNTEYAVWAKEFSAEENPIQFEMGEQICKGNGNCLMQFRLE